MSAEVLNLRRFDPETDVPRTGWDAMSIADAQQTGKQLYVDQHGDVWTNGLKEYIGRILNTEGGEIIEI